MHSGFVEKEDISGFVGSELNAAKGEDLLLVREATALSKSMNPDCGL